MKWFISIVLLTAISTNTFAQKEYVDPAKRVKRGLLDEGAKEAPSAASIVVAEDKTVKELSSQELLCACQSLEELYKGMKKLYWNSDSKRQSLINFKKYTSLDSGAEEIQIYIVQKYKNHNPAPDPDECPKMEVSEPDYRKLKTMIDAQEKVCDVYKIRGNTK